MKTKEVLVVNTCNIWKEYASFKLVGIFSSRRILNKTLNLLLKIGTINWSDEDCKDRVNDYDLKYLHDNLIYISIECVILNKKQ